MGLILDIFENFRKTKTDVKPTKPKERHYDFDDGFTGDKKSDYISKEPTPQIKTNKSISKKDKNENQNER
jgi:hypothetical protein